MASPTDSSLTTTPLVIVVADLSGYHRGFRSHSDEEMAAFLHRFYSMADHVVHSSGGRVIKFLGDAFLATYPESEVTSAISATVSLEVGIAVWASVVP